MATASLPKLSAQQVSHAVITAAMKVHTELGPGLLESAYSACLQFELTMPGATPPRRLGSRWFIAASE